MLNVWGIMTVSSCLCTAAEGMHQSDGGLSYCRLLSAALKDPLNQRFVLVSESCIPLHSPAVMWSQLMADNRSRINACADSGQDLMTWRSVTDSRLTVLNLSVSGVLCELSWGPSAVPATSRLRKHTLPAVRDMLLGLVGHWVVPGWRIET